MIERIEVRNAGSGVQFIQTRAPLFSDPARSKLLAIGSDPLSRLFLLRNHRLDLWNGEGSDVFPASEAQVC